MKWVTRERPKTDRIACPWLIKKFIDPEAEFLYAPSDQVLEVAEGKGALLRRTRGEIHAPRRTLSFEVLIEDYAIDDDGVRLLARIVHGADVSDDRDATPQSRGLLAVAEGFHLLDLGDHRQLELSLPVYDALYAWCSNEVVRPSVRMTLRRAGFIPLPPGPTAGFDHADVYKDGDTSRLLFLADTGADRVEVIDCLTQTHVGSIPDLPGVAGVLIDSDNNLLFTSDRGCSRVSVFACADKMPLGQVTVGAHPNGLAYDPERRRLYAFNLGDPIGEDCSVSVVDIDSMTVEAEIPLPGRPRWAVYDPASDLIYANIREPALILRIDPPRRDRKLDRRSDRGAAWPLG